MGDRQKSADEQNGLTVGRVQFHHVSDLKHCSGSFEGRSAIHISFKYLTATCLCLIALRKLQLDPQTKKHTKKGTTMLMSASLPPGVDGQDCRNWSSKSRVWKFS